MVVFWGPYRGSPGLGKLPNLNSSPHLGRNRKQPSFQDPSHKGSKESSLGNSQSSGLNDLKDWWSAGGHPRQWEGSRQVFRAGDYTLYPFGRQGYYGGSLCPIMEKLKEQKMYNEIAGEWFTGRGAAKKLGALLLGVLTMDYHLWGLDQRPVFLEAHM